MCFMMKAILSRYNTGLLKQLTLLQKITLTIKKAVDGSLTGMYVCKHVYIYISINAYNHWQIYANIYIHS